MSDKITEIESFFHQKIKEITLSYNSNKPNKAIAHLREFSSKLEELNVKDDNEAGLFAKYVPIFLKMLAPICPHMTQELWSLIHEKKGNEQTNPLPI